MNDRGQDYFDEKGHPEFPVIPCVSDMTIDADAVTIPDALKPLGYGSAQNTALKLPLSGISVYQTCRPNSPKKS